MARVLLLPCTVHHTLLVLRSLQAPDSSAIMAGEGGQEGAGGAGGEGADGGRAQQGRLLGHGWGRPGALSEAEDPLSPPRCAPSAAGLLTPPALPDGPAFPPALVVAACSLSALALSRVQGLQNEAALHEGMPRDMSCCKPHTSMPIEATSVRHTLLPCLVPEHAVAWRPAGYSCVWPALHKQPTRRLSGHMEQPCSNKQRHAQALRQQAAVTTGKQSSPW